MSTLITLIPIWRLHARNIVIIPIDLRKHEIMNATRPDPFTSASNYYWGHWVVSLLIYVIVLKAARSSTRHAQKFVLNSLIIMFILDFPSVERYDNVFWSFCFIDDLKHDNTMVVIFSEYTHTHTYTPCNHNSLIWCYHVFFTWTLWNILDQVVEWKSELCKR